jgi:hypothetical protein
MAPKVKKAAKPAEPAENKWPGDRRDDSDYQDTLEDDCSFPGESAKLNSEVEQLAMEAGAAADKARCVYLDIYFAPKTEAMSYSRPDIALNDEHMLILSRRLADFRTADLATRNDMVIECTERIKRVWKEKAKFDRQIVESVSARPVT